MSLHSTKIGQLLPVLDAAFRAKQAQLAKANQRIEELKVQLVSLDQPAGAGIETPAKRAGADVLWSTWVQERRKLIMQELALANRDRENARVVVAAALAKLEAARKLNDHQLQAAVKTSERRASW